MNEAEQHLAPPSKPVAQHDLAGAEREAGARATMAAVIRQLIAADERTAGTVLAATPNLRSPRLVGLLVDLAHRLQQSGREEKAARARARAGLVAGTSDPVLLDAICSLAAAQRDQLSVDEQPVVEAGQAMLPGMEAAAAPTGSASTQLAVTTLLGSVTAGSLDRVFAGHLWDAIAELCATSSTDGEQASLWADHAIEATRRAVALFGPSDPDLPRHLNNLSIRLARHPLRSSDRDTILEAVAASRRAVDLTPDDGRELRIRLGNLSNRYHQLFVVTGDRADLELSIATGRASIRASSVDMPEHRLLLENLSALLFDSVDAGGPPERVHEAMALAQQAAILAPPPDPRDAGLYDWPLPGAAGPAEAPRRPSHPDLEQAIRQQIDANYALVSSVVGAELQTDGLDLLADALARRATIVGSRRSLEEAVDIARAAVESTTRDDSRLPARLARLATQLADLHHVTGEIGRLDDAIAIGWQALNATAGDNVQRSRRAVFLIDCLIDRSTAGQDPTTSLQAVAVAEQLVEATPGDDPAHAARVSLLAQLLVVHHAQFGPDSGLPDALPRAAALLEPLPLRCPDLSGFAHRTAERLRQLPSGPGHEQRPESWIPEVERWLAALPGSTTGSGPASRNDVPRTSPADPSTRRERRQPGDSTVVLLQIQIWLLFLIPAGLRIGVLGGIGTPSLLWALLLFLVWAITSSIPPFDAARPCYPLRWTLGSFWVVNLISFALLHRDAVASDEAGNADRYLISLVAFSGIALVTAEGTRTRDQQLRVIRTAVAAVAVMCFIALLQFRPGIDLTHYLERIPGLTAYRSLNASQTRGGFNRPAGTATHPIEYAVVIGCTLALAIHVLLFDRVWPSRRRWIVLGLISMGIPIAVSRSALLVSVPVVLVFLIDADRKRRLKALGVISCLLLVVFMTIPGLLGTLKGFVFAGNSDSSISSRTTDYAAVSPYIRGAPWFGRGPGTFLPRIRVLDNQYLLSLVETGVLGLAVAIGLYSLPVWLSSASRSLMTDSADRQLSRMFLAIGLGILAAIATFDATSFPMFTLYVAFLVGLAGSHWNRAVAENQESTTCRI